MLLLFALKTGKEWNSVSGIKQHLKYLIGTLTEQRTDLWDLSSAEVSTFGITDFKAEHPKYEI